MARTQLQRGPATDHYHTALGVDQSPGGGAITVTDGTTTVDPAAAIRVAGVVDDAGTAVVQTVIISETAPDAGAAQFWLAPVDISDMGLSGGRQISYQLYARNSENDRWLLASAGATRTDAGNDSDWRTVGFFDAENGDWIGLTVDLVGFVAALKVVNSNGSTAKVEVNSGEIALRWWDVGGPFNVILDDTGIKLTGLPTADPSVADALWIDVAAGRVLKVSAG